MDPVLLVVTVLVGLLPGGVVVVVLVLGLVLSWLRANREVRELQGALANWMARCFTAERERDDLTGVEDDGEGEEWKEAGG